MMSDTFRRWLTVLFGWFKKKDKPLDAEEWLYQFASKPEKIELGLTRSKTVLQKLQLSNPVFKVITVAGTNGKGSTVQYLDSLLRADGYSVGRFTSPHLIRFNERIVVNGTEVGDAQLIEAFNAIHAAANNIKLTYFEYATLAAILIFADAQVEYAVLEVGLGGRLDAANILDADAAVITNISLDHEDWLGNDLEVIGREKAGIMRADKPVILAEANMPSSLHAVAKEIGANVFQYSKDYSLQEKVLESESGSKALKSQIFWQSNSDSNLSSKQVVELLLSNEVPINPYQQRNLAAAIAALVSLQQSVSVRAVDSAVLQGAPKGRLQAINAKSHSWLLDVAHNPAAMLVLREYLETVVGKVDKKLTVVFGMLADKDCEQCIELLAPWVKHWIAAPLASPRTLSKEQLIKLLPLEGVEVTNNIQEACIMAVDKNQNGPIVVCGSFYTVSDALKYLELS